MEEQISASQVPEQQLQVTPQNLPGAGYISPQQLLEMKERARELAFQQTMVQQSAMQQASQQSPRVVYVRRNLTVAELALVLLLSCGLVTGIQVAWNFAANVLPRLEIKVR
jgi:hypothetical protein